ncbi:hypothetical protein LZP69_08235 [Shewanella sp. AS1]|uniref:hypothetical protein n=1 Tax=Shewanella sp. AS1 TaxID=2907626 RepID=UPI001F2AE887|nr:hypothetical protein [Shewanella sp. AS1]MCE9679161.1 hypothetical protein [Shewanella sp. AS1]
MKSLLAWLSLFTLLSGCATSPDEMHCGTVSGYLEPDRSQGLYRAVVTHLDGTPVISRPNYQLPPGKYEFTLAELIDSETLEVKLAARKTKVLVIQVEAGQQYHFAAKFNQDKIYRGLETDYWQPVIWQQAFHECELAPQLP